MSAAILPRPYEEVLPKQPVSIKLPPPDSISEESHEEPMPPTKVDDLFEIKTVVHNVAGSVAVLTKVVETLVESRPQAAAPANGGKWTGWIQTGVVCGMLLVTGTNRFATGEADLKQQIALHDYQLKQKDESLRALTDRVMSIEFIWARVRQDIAAYGLQIDGKTGEITQVKKRR